VHIRDQERTGQENRGATKEKKSEKREDSGAKPQLHQRKNKGATRSTETSTSGVLKNSTDGTPLGDVWDGAKLGCLQVSEEAAFPAELRR